MRRLDYSRKGFVVKQLNELNNKIGSSLDVTYSSMFDYIVSIKETVL